MIGYQTFADATALQTIRIPASVASIEIEAFIGATGLREVVFEEGSKLEFIGDGVFADATALQTIQIPESVGHIGQGAFLNATSLQTIRIPRLVDTLMIHAFENATSLREVIFEEGSELVSIGNDAFNSATALQTIQIPAGVRGIGDEAFANTPSLREITFEQDSEISHIGYDAFRGSGLTLVVIGESALNRLNADANSRNALAINRRPFRLLPEIRFGETNDFYGKYFVKIVSRAQQIGTLQLSTNKRGYKTARKTGVVSSIKNALGLSKPPTRPRLPDDMTRKIGTYLMPKGVVPRSSAALAARATAMEEESEEEAAGGARKPRTRKRGIRRSGRKVPRTRRTMKRESKRRRTMKRK
jgi:hypothetical protein